VLSSIVEGRDTRDVEVLPEPALELGLIGQQLAVITCEREAGKTWSLRRRESGEWPVAATVPTEGDDLIGLCCSGEHVTLVTSRRLIDLQGDKAVAVALTDLTDPLPKGLISSILGTADRVFVGVNAGEWGGGLRYIDRHDGKVTTIARNATGELCGGPLNTECDPVNGIACEPWKPECIAVAIGLVHFSSHGRIVEVCGDDVQQLYVKPMDEKVSEAPAGDDDSRETVAFFGLVAQGKALWAAGIDGIYQFDADGTAHRTPLPAFKTIGEIDVSFELPNLVLVLTEVNRRKSVSGKVPMLVAR
jgi:hypothetical protein